MTNFYNYVNLINDNKHITHNPNEDNATTITLTNSSDKLKKTSIDYVPKLIYIIKERRTTNYYKNLFNNRITIYIKENDLSSIPYSHNNRELNLTARNLYRTKYNDIYKGTNTSISYLNINLTKFHRPQNTTNPQTF